MKTVSIIKYVFTVIGLAMFVGAFFMYSNTQNFLSEAIVTKGSVTQLIRSRSSDSTTYRPVVEFKTQNDRVVEFTSSTGSNPPSYSQGDVVEVLYQEDSPHEAKINGFFSLWGGTAILGGLGSVFFIIGFGIISVSTLKDRDVKLLKKRGVPVVAKFQSVEINRSLEVNGRSPYQILAQWKNPVTSELHIFNSENLWFDPTDHINQEEITVLIEKDNPKKFYVDVSFLPKLAS